MSARVHRLRELLADPPGSYPQNDVLVYAAAEVQVQLALGEFDADAQRLAVQGFRRAAEEDNPRGARAVGFCALLGVGGPADAREARRWFERAARSGDVRAAYWAAHCLYWYEARYEHALSWLETARAYDPHGDAAFLLGLMYRRGRGCGVDEQRAYQLHRDAALLGQPVAMRTLAALLAEGVGCRRDPVAAHRWREAAREANGSEGSGWAREIALLGREVSPRSRVGAPARAPERGWSPFFDSLLEPPRGHGSPAAKEGRRPGAAAPGQRVCAS
ncbi:MAG: tetratricopeptide repeat protein [Myxococcota bacterium]